jgi:alpha-galactosidase
VALFGHAGFEWDLTEVGADERAQLAEWVKLAKSLRPLVHSGELVRLDRPADPATALYGVVSDDRSEALFAFVRLQTSRDYGSPPLVLDGLEPARRYQVRRVPLPGERFVDHGPVITPPVEQLEASGSQLMRAGIAAPTLHPEQAVVYHLTAAD